MRALSLTLCLSAFAVSVASLAAGPRIPNDPNCQAVYNGCVGAKYVFGKAEEGGGLWLDCVRPLLTGTPPPKPAPAGITFPAQLAPQGATCHTNHPNWGMGRGANK